VTWAVDKAAKVRLTMLGGCARDVILADGEPVYREGAPKFIKYVLARNEGTSLTSRYTGLIEAFPSEPTILRVADLRPKDAPWDLVAMRIESTDRTDYYASSCLADRLHGFEPGIRFRGSQAFLSVRDGRVEQAILLADRPTKDSPALLEAFGVSIETASPIDGTVETSQPEAGTFTTRCDKLHEGLVGQIVLFGSSSRRCAYRLVGLQALGENRFRIELDADFIVGMSPVAKIEGRTATLSERITTYNGRFAGMTLTNEDGSATWRIAKSGTNEVTVMEDGPPLDAGKITDVDGDMDACLRVCDLGPGDEWWIPAAVHVSRQGGGYVVQARAESRLGLPKGAGLSRQEGSGAGRPIAPSSTTQETDTFLVRPGDH
jgi:hypothetical protein